MLQDIAFYFVETSSNLYQVSHSLWIDSNNFKAQVELSPTMLLFPVAPLLCNIVLFVAIYLHPITFFNQLCNTMYDLLACINQTMMFCLNRKCDLAVNYSLLKKKENQNSDEVDKVCFTLPT